MVAHGTIAFDTLTTSDQVKSGTEKSIDTSYLLNGSVKGYSNVRQAATYVSQVSFNISSVSDTGAGTNRNSLSNAMSTSTDWLVVAQTTVTSNYGEGCNCASLSSTTYDVYCTGPNNTTLTDSNDSQSMINGDLA